MDWALAVRGAAGFTIFQMLYLKNLRVKSEQGTVQLLKKSPDLF
jgi:hypothetical protein